MPDFSILIKEIEALFEVKEGMPFPKAGLDEKFDKVNLKVDKIKDKLNQILINLRKKVKCDELVYVQNKLRRYEIEAPEKFNDIIKQNDFFITSKKKGNQKFKKLIFYLLFLMNLLFPKMRIKIFRFYTISKRLYRYAVIRAKRSRDLIIFLSSSFFP